MPVYNINFLRLKGKSNPRLYERLYYMNKFTQKMMRFMYGRYGIDELYYGLFALCLALCLLHSITGMAAFSVLSTLVVVFIMYRVLSKNADKRRAENRMFLKLWNPVKNWFSYQHDRFRDRKDYRYRKCPGCRAIIKLPNQKGKHTTTCPRCHNKFNVRIL